MTTTEDFSEKLKQNKNAKSKREFTSTVVSDLDPLDPLGLFMTLQFKFEEIKSNFH